MHKRMKTSSLQLLPGVVVTNAITAHLVLTFLLNYRNPEQSSYTARALTLSSIPQSLVTRVHGNPLTSKTCHSAGLCLTSRGSMYQIARSNVENMIQPPHASRRASLNVAMQHGNWDEYMSGSNKELQRGDHNERFSESDGQNYRRREERRSRGGEESWGGTARDRRGYEGENSATEGKNSGTGSERRDWNGAIDYSRERDGRRSRGRSRGGGRGRDKGSHRRGSDDWGEPGSAGNRHRRDNRNEFHGYADRDRDSGWHDYSRGRGRDPGERGYNGRENRVGDLSQFRRRPQRYGEDSAIAGGRFDPNESVDESEEPFRVNRSFAGRDLDHFDSDDGDYNGMRNSLDRRVGRVGKTRSPDGRRGELGREGRVSGDQEGGLFDGESFWEERDTLTGRDGGSRGGGGWNQEQEPRELRGRERGRIGGFDDRDDRRAGRGRRGRGTVSGRAGRGSPGRRDARRTVYAGGDTDDQEDGRGTWFTVDEERAERGAIPRKRGANRERPGRKALEEREQPEDNDSGTAQVPDWLPPQGGLGLGKRKKLGPLPEGYDDSLKKLGVAALEQTLREKFAYIKSGALDTGDEIEFYDSDDEGYEGDYLEVEGGDPPDNSEKGLVARAETGAADGGYRMRPPSQALVPEARTTSAPPEDARKTAKASPAMGKGDDSPASPVRVESDFGTGISSGVKTVDADGGDASVPKSPSEMAGPDAFLAVANELQDQAKDAAAARDALRESDRKDGERKREKPGGSTNKTQSPLEVVYNSVVNIEAMPVLHQQRKISFRDLGITDAQLLRNVEAMGITTPTEVQISATRGLMSEDKDVVIHAYTGSGKTLAFLLPLIAAIDPDSKAVQAVVVAPGRELASQIATVLEKLLRGMDIRSSMTIGGANVMRQIERLKKLRPQIVIGTPGRLCELAFDRRRLKLSGVRYVVLDEVDALLRAPYNREIDAIMEATAPAGSRRVVFSSATGRSQVVRAAAGRYMRHDPLFVGGGIEGDNQRRVAGLPANIRHLIVTVPKMKKLDALRRFLNTQPFPESVMIFVNDPVQVTWLTEKLGGMGIIAAPLSGDSSKDDRKEVMKRLQDKRLTMVVTTEMAARGLDVYHLTHVVNYDLPTDGEHYVHRAGRCGRAGRPGIVVNLATPDIKFVMGRFAQQASVTFEDCDFKGGQVWTITRQDPSLPRKSPPEIPSGGVDVVESESDTELEQWMHEGDEDDEDDEEAEAFEMLRSSDEEDDDGDNDFEGDEDFEDDGDFEDDEDLEDEGETEENQLPDMNVGEDDDGDDRDWYGVDEASDSEEGDYLLTDDGLAGEDREGGGQDLDDGVEDSGEGQEEEEYPTALAEDVEEREVVEQEQRRVRDDVVDDVLEVEDWGSVDDPKAFLGRMGYDDESEVQGRERWAMVEQEERNIADGKGYDSAREGLVNDYRTEDRGDDRDADAAEDVPAVELDGEGVSDGDSDRPRESVAFFRIPASRDKGKKAAAPAGARGKGSLIPEVPDLGDGIKVGGGVMFRTVEESIGYLDDDGGWHRYEGDEAEGDDSVSIGDVSDYVDDWGDGDWGDGDDWGYPGAEWDGELDRTVENGERRQGDGDGQGGLGTAVRPTKSATPRIPEKAEAS